MKGFLLGALLGALALVTAMVVQPANAADLPIKAPSAPPPVFTWTGFYFGAHAGGGWADTDWAAVSFISDESFAFRPSGFVGGAHAGFNYQVGQLVFGVEGAWSATSLSDRVLDADRLVALKTTVQWIATAVGRIGFASDRWLLYASGGYAGARLGTLTTLTGCCLPGSLDVRRVENGWVVGGGVEYALSTNVIVGVDFKHIDLGKVTRLGLTDQQIPVTITDIETRINVVTARLSYKFDPLR